ncbi:hypothetical protein [Cupriavidus basilensis]|uniref:hypothetical protein n=1 Tax=Cupriavidus basilensis TaxID=68895 RepID=UPI0020A6288F|nr:hypothetical protein [Cupriavidus basilensis]MCP3025226.1 hypothetical protein [Cupriavidus basilensis]
MENINKLTEILALCVPQLDPSPLRAAPPASTDRSDVLAWFANHLEQQGLLAYEEWKEYFGHVPALQSLSGIDFAGYDDGFIVSLIEDVDFPDAETAYTLQYELPFLEHINSILQPQGLRLVDLLPFENAYIFCVKDDEDQLRQLSKCLQAFDMDINERSAMNQQQAMARLGALLGNG